jgi:hypothetical protein
MHCCGEQTSQATESDEAEEYWFSHGGASCQLGYRHAGTSATPLAFRQGVYFSLTLHPLHFAGQYLNSRKTSHVEVPTDLLDLCTLMPTSLRNQHGN